VCGRQFMIPVIMIRKWTFRVDHGSQALFC
jgi:hypothetical protein